MCSQIPYEFPVSRQLLDSIVVLSSAWCLLADDNLTLRSWGVGAPVVSPWLRPLYWGRRFDLKPSGSDLSGMAFLQPVIGFVLVGFGVIHYRDVGTSF